MCKFNIRGIFVYLGPVLEWHIMRKFRKHMLFRSILEWVCVRHQSGFKLSLRPILEWIRVRGKPNTQRLGNFRG